MDGFARSVRMVSWETPYRTANARRLSCPASPRRSSTCSCESLRGRYRYRPDPGVWKPGRGDAAAVRDGGGEGTEIRRGFDSHAAERAEATGFARATAFCHR